MGAGNTERDALHMTQALNAAEELRRICGDDRVLLNEPMMSHTSFRIGGPADYFVTPGTAEELAEVLSFSARAGIPAFVMGNGTNLLVADAGYRGVIVQLLKNMNDIRVEGNEIIAQAGALLSAVAARALEASLTGFEFAAGIPGTLGGACTMNAGAYGGEMKDVLVSVKVLDAEGNIRILPAEDLALGYRTSAIMKGGMIVLEAVIRLSEGDPEAISSYMKELAGRRRDKQPLDKPSAGSTFKRPEGYFAGKLIQDAGLRGKTIGGAQVSEKHCGFVINTGSATAADVMNLIDFVRETVLADAGVTLTPEVRFLGF